MSLHTFPANPGSCSGSTLGLLLRQARDAMWAHMSHELVRAGHDLTFSQYVTIKKLAAGTASVTDLARWAELNPGAMTRLLDRLEARGLIARVADPADRRALHIHLTPAGQTIWCDVEQCGLRVCECAMAGMCDDQRNLLMRMLVQVRDNLLVTDR